MAVTLQNNRRMMSNLLLARTAITQVVQELVQSPPTEDELRLLAQVAEEACERDLSPTEIESRLRHTRLWRLLVFLANNDVRIIAYLTLLLMIYQTYLMQNPEPQPPPQVTVNVTVDTAEIAENVAKRLEDEGVCVVPEPTEAKPKQHK
jgi:hypothetical protein